MRNEPQSLYQILRVPKHAKPEEIERAYRRIKHEQQKETTPPDTRLRVMLEHAHDVLMDPVRREAYDKQWYAPTAQISRARRSPAGLAAMAAAVASVAAAAWMITRTESAPQREARPRPEIQSAVGNAVGRVSRVDLSGTRSTLGLAFAIAEGTLVTSCEGLSPNAEVFVNFGKRAAPVRVGAVDDPTGLCKLTGGSVGSWPLSLAHLPPHPNEPMYTVVVGPTNDAQLVDTKYRRPGGAAGLSVFQAERAPSARDLGAPLLDLEGRVVGAASRVGGTLAWVPVPKGFLPEVIVERAPPEPKVQPEAPEPKSASEPRSAAEPKPPPEFSGPNISPERRERLEKAFRPPPTVPDDL